MKVTLTAPTLEYVNVIQQCASDSRVSATCNVPEPYPVDGASRWIQYILESMAEGKSAIFFVLADSKFAGVMSLNRIDRNAGTCDLDYWIAADYQGQGVGSEAVRLVLEEARNTVGSKSVSSTCLSDNPRSSRVLEKNGFNEIGRFVNDGRYGKKFLGREMRQFRKDFVVENAV